LKLKAGSTGRCKSAGLLPACWHADLTAHGDVHPHPGPAVQLRSCNCGRGTGAMEFFEHARAKGIPILAIREDGLKPGERDHFIDMSISITTARLTGPAGSATRTHGEVIILVKGNLRCHLINQLSEDEGQVVTVMVEHIAISCHF